MVHAIGRGAMATEAVPCWLHADHSDSGGQPR